MGTSTFSGPIKSGTRKGSTGTTATTAANTGNAVLSQSASITFADDGSTTTIATLPANSQIVEIYLDITTAFNAATTNTISFGDGTTSDQYAATLAAGTVARVLATSDASQITNLTDIGAADVQVVATYNQTGTAATAGAAIATVVYIQK